MLLCSRRRAEGMVVVSYGKKKDGLPISLQGLHRTYCGYLLVTRKETNRKRETRGRKRRKRRRAAEEGLKGKNPKGARVAVERDGGGRGLLRVASCAWCYPAVGYGKRETGRRRARTECTRTGVVPASVVLLWREGREDRQG